MNFPDEKREKQLTRLTQEAYQIVAILATDAGEFNSHPVQNALDKLSAAANEDPIPDIELLPFMVEGKFRSQRKRLAEAVVKHLISEDKSGEKFCVLCGSMTDYTHTPDCIVLECEKIIKEV